jgi:hypothetical protein
LSISDSESPAGRAGPSHGLARPRGGPLGPEMMQAHVFRIKLLRSPGGGEPGPTSHRRSHWPRQSAGGRRVTQSRVTVAVGGGRTHTGSLRLSGCQAGWQWQDRRCVAFQVGTYPGHGTDRATGGWPACQWRPVARPGPGDSLSGSQATGSAWSPWCQWWSMPVPSSGGGVGSQACIDSCVSGHRLRVEWLASAKGEDSA